MSRTNYIERVAADRRLAILQIMVEEGGQSNERNLFIALRAMGHSVGLEQAGVRQFLTDLEARMCVTTTLYEETLLVARVTDRGRLVVAGDVRIDGIANLSPVL